MTDPVTPDPAFRLRELATQYFVSRSLHAAAEFDVAAHLEDGPKTAAQLAACTGAHADALCRLLRALASAGVFEEVSPGVFTNNPLSAALSSRAPGAARDLVTFFGHETAWRTWEHAPHSIRTGEPAFEHVFGQPVFDYLATHPDAAMAFDRAMAASSAATEAAVRDSYDFSALRWLVDVAGGTGATLCSLLRAYPEMRGTVMDLPHVASRAREAIAAQGLASRCEFVSGDMFEHVPDGADAYFMKHILHDWSDDACMRILSACRRAAGPQARLLVCERIVPEGNAPSSAKWIDLHMLVSTPGGRERTLEEYRQLLARGGFALTHVFPTSTPWSLMEAAPVPATTGSVGGA